MKLRVFFTLLCLSLLSISLLLMGCDSKSDNEKISSGSSKTENEKYIIQTPLYRIYEEGLQKYRYKIGTDKKVFSKGVKNGTEPKIDNIENGIIRLFMGSGTNNFSVQYFDVWGDKTSKVFYPYSIYADYADSKTKECLIAYFESPGDYGKNILLIKDIFNEKGFSAEVDRGFISATCNRLVFLNENEIYLDYDVLADGYSNDDLIAGNPVEYKNIREVVKFRLGKQG